MQTLRPRQVGGRGRFRPALFGAAPELPHPNV